MQVFKMNLVLIDQHDLLAKALSHLLEGFDFVNNVTLFKTPQEYFQQSATLSADIIITDIRIPEMNSVDILAEIKKYAGDTKIIILSSIGEPVIIRHALRIGINGYLGKDISPSELKNAILAVQNGDTYISERLRKDLENTIADADRGIPSLSPREKEVLLLVCSGKTMKETAQEMKLSFNTVQAYYKSVLKKFNISRTADLIVFAIQHGLYTPKANNL
jgi:DNA-binding NarL/FixJ family response regulator